MSRLDITETGSGVTLEIRLHPRAGRDRVAGVSNGKLKIDVSSAPVKNQANRSMIKLLSKELKVPQGAITIKRGLSGRDKLIKILDITSGEVINYLQSRGRGTEF
jgi:hypothetical protein